LACDPRRISEVAAVELSVTVPAEAACVIAPVSVMEPPDVIESVLLPTEEVPSDKAALLTKLTAFAPELLSETEPVKLLPVLARVSTPAPAVKLAAPAEAAWVIAVLAACVMPTPVMFKVPVPTPMLPKLRAEPFVRETLPLPLLESVTAPVKALFCVKVMAWAPAVKLEVPGTVIAPV